MAEGQTGYLLLACPQCHVGYKIHKDLAETEVVCRSCGHRWTPARARDRKSPAQAAPSPPAGAKAPPAPERPPAPVRPVPTPREDVSDPLVGADVNGFRIQSRIGTGGFGVVYRAFDVSLERSVALKMLPPKLAKEGERLINRFLREARSAAKLSHPNIVTIHQIVPYEDTFYIVMELVDGGALHEFLAVQKRFRPAEATRIIRVAAEGLAHAHKRGVIHRDIKPGNIMMTNDGQVKVSDFGLARDVLQGHDIVGPGHSLGTPRYMAPEQALGEEPTAASDLYSLAATYYVLLTGRAPFDAENDRQMMRMHVQAPVPDPRRHVPTLPVAVFRFFQKAMAKLPEDRYVTAEEFVEMLDRLDFSATDESGTPTPQALSSQLGRIAPEDRGSHLSRALGRAVRRSQRVRLTAASAKANEEDAKPRRWLSGWRLVALIVAAALALVGAAAVVAYVLAPKGGLSAVVTPGDGPETPPETPIETPPQTPAETPTQRPPETPTQRPPETPTQKPPETPTQRPPETPTESPRDLMEENAQIKLEEARRYEGATDDILNQITAYQGVLNVYPNTKAAEEARQAIARLRGEGDEAGGDVPSGRNDNARNPNDETMTKPE